MERSAKKEIKEITLDNIANLLCQHKETLQIQVVLQIMGRK